LAKHTAFCCIGSGAQPGDEAACRRHAPAILRGECLANAVSSANTTATTVAGTQAEHITLGHLRGNKNEESIAETLVIIFARSARILQMIAQVVVVTRRDPGYQ
jgi:hypothetical protein